MSKLSRMSSHNTKCEETMPKLYSYITCEETMSKLYSYDITAGAKTRFMYCTLLISYCTVGTKKVYVLYLRYVCGMKNIRFHTTTALCSYFHRTFTTPTPYLFRRIYYSTEYNYSFLFLFAVLSLSLYAVLLVASYSCFLSFLVYRRYFFVAVLASFLSLCSLAFLVNVLASFSCCYSRSFAIALLLITVLTAFFSLFSLLFLVIVLLTNFRRYFLVAFLFIAVLIAQLYSRRYSLYSLFSLFTFSSLYFSLFSFNDF